MRAPVAARELALTALKRLPASLQADAGLTVRLAASESLKYGELLRIREILTAAADTPEQRYAQALVGGAPMLRAIQAAPFVPGDDPAHSGAMVALTPADPEAIAVEDGLPPEELHVTLRYLGDSADLDDVAASEALEDLRGLADQIPVFSVGDWEISHFGGPDVRDAGYVAVVAHWRHDDETLNLPMVHAAVSDILDAHELENASTFDGAWEAHLTLTYLPIEEAEADWPEGSAFEAEVTFDAITFHRAGDQDRIELAATDDGPNILAAAGKANTWPALNAEIQDLYDAWDRTDDILTAQVSTAVEMGWRNALERVGRSITKATSGDRSQAPAFVAASGQTMHANGVNPAQLISGPVSDTVAQVRRILAGAWAQPLAEIFDRFAVLLTPDEVRILAAASETALQFLETQMTGYLLARLAGPASTLLAEEPIPVDDPGAIPAQLVSDVLAIASTASVALDGGGFETAHRDNAGRPIGQAGNTGGDGLLRGPAGSWILDLVIDAWADPQNDAPILAAGRRGAGALISADLRSDLADAADLGASGVERVQIVENTWTLEMNGKIQTKHDPVHEALGGTVIVTESELDEIPGAAGDPDVFPYVGTRRPGDHRYCKCGWKTTVRFVAA